MVRPSFACLKRICLALVALPGLVACGDLEVELGFETLQSGTVRLRYEVLPEFRYVEGRAHPLGWPVDRAEWNGLVSRVQGLSLTEVTLEERAGTLVVTALLRFANLQALEGLAIQLGQRLTVIGVQNVFTLTADYQLPVLQDQRLRAITRLSLQGKRIVWNVTLPRAPRDLGRAQAMANGRGFTVQDDLVAVWEGRVGSLRVVW